MAQLKDLLVSGPSRLIGKLFANEAQLTTLNIPTTSGGTTYGPGTNNQVLTSNGTTVYWASGFSGNASTADKLKTARTINGTSFDGSANITTANWGTARTLTIGNKGQSVNGSANVSWTLQDVLIRSGNEFNYTADGNSSLWFNYKTQTGTSAGTAIANYHFGNGQGAITGVTVNAATFKGNLTGNADTATKFASAQSVTLTGDVTGSASSQAGWSVATTLANSGVTAASYGPSANATPGHGGTFSVPYLTVDAKGRITAASTKTITLPADSNTDTKVTQTNTTGSADYRILFSGNANDTNETTTVRKNTNLKYNPSTKNLQLTSGILTLGTSHINQATTTGTATAAADSGASASPNRYKPALWKFNYGIVPVTGDTIVIKTPGVGHDYGTWLSLDNGTTYHPICTWQGTSHSRVTTHFPAGSYLYLVYDANQVTDSVFESGGSDARKNITGSWCVVNFYDANTTRVWELYKAYGHYTAQNAINRYQIIFSALAPNQNKLISLFGTDNNLSTGKTLLTTEFDPLGEIFYYYSSGVYAANATVDAGRLNYTALADLRYTFNITNDTSVAATTAFRGVSPNRVYLRVTINHATGGAKVDGNQPLVTTLPTSADGKYYIYLGNVYDWYRIYLNRDHPVYFHDGTKLTEYKGHTTTTNSLVLTGSTNATMTAASTNPKITFMENANTQPVHLIYTDQDSYRSPAGLKIIGGTSATPAWLEVEGSYYATGTSTGQGYQILGNGVEYGRWWLNTIGKAGTATTYTNPDDSSQTKTGYTGNVTGNIYLSIGNNKAVGSNGSSYASPGTAGTANNAQGYLRLYSSGTAYGEMTGYGNYIYPTNGIAFPENKVALNFRPSSSSYYSHFSHQTSGNEALVMATQNAVTSFIFVNGESISNIASDRWTKLTGASGAGNAPGLQIKNNCVSIGKLIPNNTTPTYKLEVNGTSYLNGNTAITGILEVTAQGNTFSIGSQNTSYNHLYNSANIPFIFNNTVLTTTGNLGNTSYPFNNLYIGKGGTKGIYYVGSQSTNEMITFVENTTDANGNGIKIGGGGVVVVGSGESSSNLSVNGGDEVLYLLSDGALNVEANAQTIANRIGFQVTTAGAIVPVKAEAANNNAQDIGTSSNKWKNIYATTFTGNLAGNASTADSATSAGSATTASKAGAANITTTANAVAYYTNTTGTFGSKASANGALYATSANGALTFGTLPIAQGGTGLTSSPSMLVNLASTTADTVLKASPRPGVTGTLGVAHGGTGQTTAAGIFNVVRDNGGNSTWVNVSGDTMTGTLTIKGLKGTSNTDYGTALPSSGSEGQIFFQISDETYEIPAGGTTGQALIKNSNTDRDVKWGPVGGQQTPNNSAKFYPSGSTSTSANTGDAVFNTSVYVQNSVLFGAAWNDYAEYRETTTPVEAGRVVVENGDDTLSLSTERMQPGAEIVSDTFGFAIGQTEKSKTAIAASGRVLAYPHEPRRTYKPGQPVCSGPNGTVSQMTDEEARMYPWCIIGTVSSIPEYDTWGEENIQVNGRIWIRIR